MATMARHQVAATVVGCMSVYCDVVEVQAYGLDTLAKIAKFRPVIDKKVCLDLFVMMYTHWLSKYLAKFPVKTFLILGTQSLN